MKNSLVFPWTGSSSFTGAAFFFLSAAVVVVAGAPPSVGKALASARGAATLLLLGMNTVEPAEKLEARGVEESLLAEVCADREAVSGCMLKTFGAATGVGALNTCYCI